MRKKKRSRGNAFFLLSLEILRERGFRLFDDRVERGGVADGELAEILAVDDDLRFFQTGDEAAIRDAERTARGVDAHDPKLAEFAFAIAAMVVGVAIGAIDGVLSVAEATGLQPEKAFRLFQNAFATRAGCGSICNS